MSELLGELHELLDRYDAEFECNTGSCTAWAGQLRVTLTNPDDRPSRSMTFYAAGRDGPDGVMRAVITDFKAWLAQTGVEPMPVPEWMR